MLKNKEADRTILHSALNLYVDCKGHAKQHFWAENHTIIIMQSEVKVVEVFLE